MIFSFKNSPETNSGEPASSLFRVVQQLLEGCALHSVEFDSAVHADFRKSIRAIASRFESEPDYKDLLIMAGEANRTIQNYNEQVEKFIRELSIEKQRAVEVLTESLIRVCQSNEKTTQNLRHIEKDLSKTSQLQDMRVLRVRLEECVAAICAEAEAQEAQYRELKERIAESSGGTEPRDQVTGLSTLKSAESRLKELSTPGRDGFAQVFFLKNVDVVNRRFGFSAGDEVLRKFSAYLQVGLQDRDELYRWRGPCFVIVTERRMNLDAAQAQAYRMGVRGPEVEVESEGKSMLIRLTAATTAFPIPKGPGVAELSVRIDQFAAEQFKMAPVPR